jgi:hypothetical protein
MGGVAGPNAPGTGTGAARDVIQEYVPRKGAQKLWCGAREIRRGGVGRTTRGVPGSGNPGGIRNPSPGEWFANGSAECVGGCERR